MSDYISREAVGKALTTAEPINNGNIKYNRYPPSHDEVLKRISAIHAADVVEQKHGKWIRSVDELGEAWMCSECLEEFFPADGMDEFISYVHYCPNCGAAMWGDS